MKEKIKKCIELVENAKVLLAYVLVVLFLTITFLIIDDCALKSNCCRLIVLKFKANLLAENILDAFYVIWGMTVTLVLFLFEFGNTYWYGVNLKRITRLSLNLKILVYVAIEYIFFCPLVYYSNTRGKGFTCLWGCFCTFVTFCVTVLYIISKTQKQEIKRLLKNSTIREIKRNIQDDSQEKECLQKYIEELSIVEMIKHIDYNDTAEVQALIVTLSEIITDKEITSIIKGKQYDYLIIMIWVKHIINFSGIGTERERERTEYVLRKLWENIISIIEEKKKENRGYVIGEAISYTVQILIPLIEIGTNEATEVFLCLWKSVMRIQPDIIWYIFLYEEFLYYRCGKRKREYCILVEMVDRDRKTLSKCTSMWNKTKAWEFWRSWITLKETGNNMAFSLFFEFCRDVEKIQKEQIYDVNTYAMRRYYLGTR